MVHATAGAFLCRKRDKKGVSLLVSEWLNGIEQMDKRCCSRERADNGPRQEILDLGNDLFCVHMLYTKVLHSVVGQKVRPAEGSGV